MAVVLDGTSGTRTARWLKAMGPQSVLRYIPTISVIGVPLAFIVAREYEQGKAAFYGIPEDYVRVGPIDAIAPFAFIATLLWLLFILAHEIEQVGIARIANYIGSMLRLVFAIVFLILLGIAFADELKKPDGVLFTFLLLQVYVLFAVAVYAVLWWLPPGIAWIGRRVVGAIAKARATPARPGKFQRHIFRGYLDYRGSSNIKRLWIAAVIVVCLLGRIPNMLGWWDAGNEATFAGPWWARQTGDPGSLRR